MPVPVPCPHCDQTIRLPDHLYDQPAQCPLCSGAFVIRWRRNRAPDANGDSAPASGPDRFPCRFCGQPIRAEALKCPFCRRWQNTEG
jgi:hypothetical protein